MLKVKSVVFTALLIIIIFAKVFATDKLLVVGSEKDLYNPAIGMQYFVDEQNSLAIQNIIDPAQQLKFIDVDGEIPHFGITSSTIWLKFDIRNHLENSPYLEINSPSLDTIEYFLVDNSKNLVHHNITGNFEKIDKRKIQTSQFLFDMNLEKDQVYTCYLRTRSESSSIILPITIASIFKLYESDQRNTIWQGIYYGLIIFLFIYNLFLFFSVKDSSYLYFALFIACLGFMFSIFNGMGLLFIWSSYPFSYGLMPMFGAGAGIFMILFSARFLNSRAKTPKLHIWLLALIGLFVGIIIMCLIGRDFYTTQLLFYNSLTGLFFLMFLAITAYKDGYKPARFYLMAWSFFVIGMITSFLREIDLISLNFLVENILQITSTLSIMFMSFALGKKINVYIDKRNEAQEMALKSALQNEKLIANQNLILESKVNQRTHDLEQTINTLKKQGKDLEEANNFKTKILSIISHDLKSPISSLAGLLQVMRLKTLNEKERSDAVNSLEIALKGTKNLLDNILAWANKSGNKKDELVEIEIHNVISEVMELFQFQSATKDIQLVNRAAKGFHIFANENMIRLVLRNLISNAIKFTPKRGKVEVGMRQNHLDFELYIKDSGMGMSEEVKRNLFQTGKHMTTRGTENEKGTGLGLLLCKEFVEKYNGTIKVESSFGKGSKFTITLKDAIPVLEAV